MYYIFFINSIEFGEQVWSAKDIMNFLLGNNIWAFSSNAPNLRNLNEGDKVVIYLAGKGNRAFAADFAISSKPYEVEPEPNDPDWLDMFSIRIDVKDVRLWVKQVPIGNIIEYLDFIKDKKNYGLYFRQSTRVIDEKDFMIIIDGQNFTNR